MIAVTCSNPNLTDAAKKIAQQLHLPFVSTLNDDHTAFLVLTAEHLQLQLSGKQAPGPIFVDFIGGALGHRLRFGGGRRQLMGRAVGVTAKNRPRVLDVTAGLGRDAYVLANMGCDVTMIENSPIIAALLKDGLSRAANNKKFSLLKLQFIEENSIQYLKQLSETEYPDVIYLDPMFPPLKKTAAVKKEMQVLKEIVGADQHADELLQLSRTIAKKRVVVKRHRHIETIGNTTPDLVFTGKSSRFDVYIQAG